MERGGVKMDKVIDIEDRIPTLRKKRRKRTNIKFIVLISLFLLALFLLLYFQSPYSNIKKINIVGAELVEEEVYITDSELKIGESIWSFRAKDIEEKIAKHNWVENVEVNRKWLTTVEIQVNEYKKVAYIVEDDGFFPMLENGVIFESSNGLIAPIDAPLFLQFDDEKLRKMLLKELSQLTPEVLASISQINANPTSTNPYSITLFMNDGFEVRAETTSLAEKLNYYPAIVAQIESTGEFEKGIIDIEVGTYYRPYSDEYVNINVKNINENKKKQEVKTDEKEESE